MYVVHVRLGNEQSKIILSSVIQFILLMSCVLLLQLYTALSLYCIQLIDIHDLTATNQAGCFRFNLLSTDFSLSLRRVTLTVTY